MRDVSLRMRKYENYYYNEKSFIVINFYRGGDVLNIIGTNKINKRSAHILNNVRISLLIDFLFVDFFLNHFLFFQIYNLHDL